MFIYTFGHIRRANIQINLYIRTVWWESSLDALFLHADKETHYENTPIQIYWTFDYKKKKEKIQIKHSDIFHIFAQT